MHTLNKFILSKKILATVVHGVMLFGLIGITQAAELAASQQSATQALPIDRIVAIVSSDVITQIELSNRLVVVEQQLKSQGTPLPAPELLKAQMLERMIVNLLQIQFARETGVRVDDTQLDKSLRRIAQENKFSSLAEFRARLEEDGVNFKNFREEIRNEIIFTRLREREVENKLAISESEIDSFLANQNRQTGKNEEYHLAHILVRIPEQASADKIQASRTRAEKALAELLGGTDFGQVAAGFSDAPDALQGGNLGWRTADRIPGIFLDVLQKIQPNNVSPILNSPNGFHILKLIERRSKDAPIVITQTHVRHILIKTSEWMSETDAKKILLDIKKRIDQGADFVEQAKQFSEDGSAVQGGDLGWISPGETVPEFESTMQKLKPGEISDAVQSGFGWHLIQVLERRSADVTVEQKRQRAHQAIRAFKADEAYQDWLRQLRDRAYIEYRPDPIKLQN